MFCSAFHLLPAPWPWARKTESALCTSCCFSMRVIKRTSAAHRCSADIHEALFLLQCGKLTQLQVVDSDILLAACHRYCMLLKVFCKRWTNTCCIFFRVNVLFLLLFWVEKICTRGHGRCVAPLAEFSPFAARRNKSIQEPQ